jgi:DNA-binding GntR family transcriptional regulator
MYTLQMDTARRLQVAGATDKAYQIIREQMLAGRWPGGAPLKEAELAVQLGMSRTPVREALRRLVADGLAQFRPNHGVTTLDWTPEDWREVFDLRAMLESRAAALAAVRATQEELVALDRLCSQMEALADTGAEGSRASIGELNAAFHRTLVAASCNRHLIQLVASLSHSMSIFRSYRSFTQQELLRSMAHHRDILAGLVARDSEWAAAAVRAHILAGRSKISVEQDP